MGLNLLAGALPIYAFFDKEKLEPNQSFNYTNHLVVERINMSVLQELPPEEA